MIVKNVEIDHDENRIFQIWDLDNNIRIPDEFDSLIATRIHCIERGWNYK